MDDFSADKHWLESTHAAVLNILDDFNWEKEKVQEVNDELRQEIVERKEAEERLTDAVAEKEILLKEVHHRVKNNLQVVSSLFSLQGRMVSDPQWKSLFQESQNRVMAIALVHEKLYQSENLSQIDFGDYIQNLLPTLLEASEAGDRVDVQLQIEHVKLSVNQAIPCGLIINELVTNAIKHGFREGRRGSLGIELREERGHRKVVVWDDGVGISPKIDLQRTKSLGLQLVFTLAKQLGGSMEVERGPRTTFRLAFAEEG